ncbi:MarR family winged helix-turn-helix transcriptional regulator [Gordonia sp. LSe1-13]|uniref:MarR family winged helix-turn-helix transcriptional regulator n=1 Tax=Gordonia sesuvii TaxID=3116777 RepID=A0ABU7MAZ7_9ACTN|nr:MarR family winged helix-turn-helix transcriptional regulator [Gordonia sp. LSe1-13]
MSTSEESRDATTALDAACATFVEFLERLNCVGQAKTMDALAATDLTFSQMRVLFGLAAHYDAGEDMSVNDIADHVGLSLAAAGRTVDKLVSLDLVDRREDPTDRRVKRISLTAAGTQVVTTQLDIKRETVRAFVTGLSQPLRDDLNHVLRAIIDADVDHFSVSTDRTSTPSTPDHTQKATS